MRVCGCGYLCEIKQHHIRKLGFCNKNLNTKNRTLARVKVTCQYAVRQGKKVLTEQDPRNPIYVESLELYTHTDTFVAGRNCSVVSFSERICDIMPYYDDYWPKEGVPIYQVATDYTSINGQRSILVLNEALWIPKLVTYLMNPNKTMK